MRWHIGQICICAGRPAMVTRMTETLVCVTTLCDGNESDPLHRHSSTEYRFCKSDGSQFGKNTGFIGLHLTPVPCDVAQSALKSMT